MRSLVPSLLAALVAILPAAVGEAQTREFQIRNDGGSRIQFVSDAPLETITGVSSHVTGTVRVNPDDVSSTRGTVRVRVASLRTGVDLRDEHLRGDDWLDAQRHPNASFEITGVEGASSLEPNRSTRVRVRGRFTIHGVTRDVTANAQVRLIPLNDELRRSGIDGDVLRVQASFQVELDEHNVSIALPVRLKVSNEIQVNVTIRAIAGNGRS